MRKLCYLFVVSGLLLAFGAGLALAREYSEQEEAKLGKEGTAEIEKQFKVLTDAAQLKRLDAIVKQIAPVTQRPKVAYTVKILDTRDVNALSLPGGFLYVTKGLLDAAESDDELAAVLAHEVAHNAHKHSLHQLDRSASLDKQMMLAVLAAVVLARDNVDPGHLVLVGNVLKLNALNGYGQKAELEADRSAVEYLIKSKKYNPVGMLSFLESLQRGEGLMPYDDLGIFRTHPPTPERVAAIRAQLEEAGVPIVRLPGKNTPTAKARAVTAKGKEIAEVVIAERALFQPAAELAGKTPLQRAEEMARRVSEVFTEYAEGRQVRVLVRGDARVVAYRGDPLIEIGPEDAAFHETTTDDLAENTAKALRAAIWDDFVRRAQFATPATAAPR